MVYYPLLDIQQALSDADRNLQDIVTYLSQLLDDSDGCYPVEAGDILRNVAAARAHLASLFPTTFQEQIANEQAQYDADLNAYSA